ncbi:hypothetical protein FI667_g17520, partial [Globisporangium splendens]
MATLPARLMPHTSGSETRNLHGISVKWIDVPSWRALTSASPVVAGARVQRESPLGLQSQQETPPGAGPQTREPVCDAYQYKPHETQNPIQVKRELDAEYSTKTNQDENNGESLKVTLLSAESSELLDKQIAKLLDDYLLRNEHVC